MDQPSEPESQIIGILNNLQVLFDRERKFNDLRSKSDHSMLPVDFALNINGFLAIIEYNGAQHYAPKNNSESAKNAFRRLTANGTSRLNFCEKNNIPLLIIHYKDKDQIQTIIKSFIDDINNDLHNRTQKYTAHTKGFFHNVPYSAFQATPDGPISPLQFQEDSNLGYLKLSPDAIVWTQTELNTLLARIDEYKEKVEQYQTITANLVLNIDSLRKELVEKNKLLEIKSQPIVAPESEVPANKETTFNGKFRMTNSPRSRLTADARVFIKTLSVKYDDISKIQAFLSNKYNEKISLPTLKKCLK